MPMTTQAKRNAILSACLTPEALAACTAATEALYVASGAEVDQYGTSSRVHGNA